MENPEVGKGAVSLEQLRPHWKTHKCVEIARRRIRPQRLENLDLGAGVGHVVGAAQGVRVYEARGKEPILAPAAAAVLYVLVGILLLFNPDRGVELLTAVITIFLFAQGVFQLIVAWQLRPTPAYGYVGGIISVLLAAAIWMRRGPA